MILSFLRFFRFPLSGLYHVLKALWRHRYRRQRFLDESILDMILLVMFDTVPLEILVQNILSTASAISLFVSPFQRYAFIFHSQGTNQAHSLGYY
jgi:hypothetical protein